MEFVRIPAGSFMMGSPRAEQREYERCAKRHGYDFTVTDEEEHRVRISKDFFLGKYPVTQEQYEAITGGKPSGFSATGIGKDRVKGMDTRRFPVESVSWEDAVAFCAMLKARDRLQRPFRLPSEAEWECACRGGTTTAFYFGDKLDGTQANCAGSHPFGTDVPGPSLERTTRVGAYEAKAPHPWGLGDVHGNVFQWCQDWYDEGYYKRSPPVDPLCTNGERQGRVLRGGGWGGYAWDCRAASRIGVAPGKRYPFVGFRVALGSD
jgi:formylglycine-generating enzyme required for sulfatase activity